MLLLVNSFKFVVVFRCSFLRTFQCVMLFHFASTLEIRCVTSRTFNDRFCIRCNAQVPICDCFWRDGVVLAFECVYHMFLMMCVNCDDIGVMKFERKSGCLMGEIKNVGRDAVRVMMCFVMWSSVCFCVYGVCCVSWLCVFSLVNVRFLVFLCTTTQITTCRQIHLTRDFFSTLSSLCTHHIVAQACLHKRAFHPHVITCLSFCCFLVLSSSSVSRASSFVSHFYLFLVLNFNSHVVEVAEH